MLVLNLNVHNFWRLLGRSQPIRFKIYRLARVDYYQSLLFQLALQLLLIKNIVYQAVETSILRYTYVICVVFLIDNRGI